MEIGTRGLRERVVRALAKVGLVWAVAVLGALFMTMSSQGQEDHGGYSLTSEVNGDHAAFSVSSGDGPRTAGLALALVVIAGGATVLAIGASRGQRVTVRTYAADPEPEPVPDLSLSLGLGLLA